MPAGVGGCILFAAQHPTWSWGLLLCIACLCSIINACVPLHSLCIQGLCADHQCTAHTLACRAHCCLLVVALGAQQAPWRRRDSPATCSSRLTSHRGPSSFPSDTWNSKTRSKVAISPRMPRGIPSSNPERGQSQLLRQTQVLSAGVCVERTRSWDKGRSGGAATSP